MALEPGVQKSLIRRLLPLLPVAAGLAAIYDGAVFYGRWSAERDFERRKSAAEAARLRQNVEMAGGGVLKIAGFYASPGAIRAGDSANLCYSVTGAKSVRLVPPVVEVWPALMRCVAVSPTRDTEYRLTAQDDKGREVSETFVLRVER